MHLGIHVVRFDTKILVQFVVVANTASMEEKKIVELNYNKWRLIIGI